MDSDVIIVWVRDGLHSGPRWCNITRSPAQGARARQVRGLVQGCSPPRPVTLGSGPTWSENMHEEWRVESGECPLTRCHDTRHIIPAITSLTDTAPAAPPCLCHDPRLTMTITTDYDCQPQFSALGLDPELPRQSSSDWSGLRQAGL